MGRDELASELDELKPGDCVSLTVDRFKMLFGSDEKIGEEAVRGAIALAKNIPADFSIKSSRIETPSL